MNLLAKNAGFNIVATLVTAVTGFLASLIAARLLGPAAFGLLSFLTWIFTTLVLLADPGLSSATQKFVAELQGAGQAAVGNRLTLILLILQCGIGLCAGISLAVFSPWLSAILNQPASRPYLVVLGVGLPAAMALAVLRARLAGFQRFDVISGVSVLSAVITLAGTILLLHYGLGVGGLIWLMVGLSLLQLVFLAPLVWKHYNLRPREPIPAFLRHKIIGYCLGVFIWTSNDAIIWQRSETFFLGRYSTVDQIGYYGLAYGLAGALVTMLPFAIAGVLMPALSRHFGAGQRDAMQNIYATATRYVVMLSLPLALGSIAIARPAVELIYGSGYSPAVWPLRILLFAGVAGSLGGVCSALFLALGKPLLAGLLGIPIAILNLALGYLLVPSHGALGAALANTTCQVLGVAAGTSYLLFNQHYRLPVKALFRTALAASLSAVLAYLMLKLLTGWVGLLVAVLLAAVVYVPALTHLGIFDPADFTWLREITKRLPDRIKLLVDRLLSTMEAASLRSR